jgi:hypothetical protein
MLGGALTSGHFEYSHGSFGARLAAVENGLPSSLSAALFGRFWADSAALERAFV